MLNLPRILSSVHLDRTDIPSQVTIPERKVLKSLTADTLSGRGAVVDLGAGAGSSTLAMVEGLALRGAAFPEVHSYDWFALGPGHFATDKFKAVSNASDASFLEDFKYFLRPYLPKITIHAGDIKKEKWGPKPIDVLHVDLCKDLDIFEHIAREFFPALREGSFLVHQDFSRPRLPWLHYSAGIMEPVLEPLARTGGSVFYKVKAPLSSDLISEMVGDMSIEKRKSMARRGIENARKAQHHASEHFACLADLTDIYIDFWFNDRRLAKERYEESPHRDMFRKFYPELEIEVTGRAG